MFKLKDNATIGKYLANLIKQKYNDNQRDFCRACITLQEGDPEDKSSVDRMANHISQIIGGRNNSIPLDDFPIFTELLGVTCEQILSAGDYSVPVADRVTNYSIASSKDPAEWERYINRADKLILNNDEYCKTVLDYALEFGNYEFIKYLMDNKYIWFDSRNDNDYVLNFGAGTSIERRGIGSIDWGLQKQLFEDELRLNLIALAVDNDDLKMLNDLHARENPQLYYNAHYLSCTHPDFDSCYNERMIKHIACSSEKVLDYFTDYFDIRDNVRYKDGSKRVHTFMFPYISKLLDFLISEKSVFAETALKKALKYNKETYNKLCKLVLAVKNDERYADEYMKGMWIKVCEDELDFYENGDIVLFRAFYSTPFVKNQTDGIITNVPHVTKIPASPILKHLAEELNESYEAVKNLKENLEEI